MDIKEKIDLCLENYKKWKNLALKASSLRESRKCMEKAFFWIELQSAFLTLFSIEETKGKDPEVKRKLLMAKANLIKKLVEYTENLLKEIESF